MTSASAWVRGYGYTAESATNDLIANRMRDEWTGWQPEGDISIDDEIVAVGTTYYTASQIMYREVD